MDTDYLTRMAYDCLIYANDATDVLKSELGAACKEFRTEDQYLAAILDHVIEIEEDPEDYLDWWNWTRRISKRSKRRSKDLKNTFKRPCKLH